MAAIPEHRGTLNGDEYSILAASGDAIFIGKEYGPLIMADIAVLMDTEACEWVILRSCPVYAADGNYLGESWEEECRIAGQRDEDFYE